ncbi:hypothetical protein LSCM1_07754 [Leishmania martiniquensis]|uniref:Uncharacterized protein n=1 Tax=Leishmania martiniquensis TaxID=1580590 RepID=A0A836HT32_9TRYP|nr:hypothetical protein LSCM1_07754 [Leishmania martiniquensis]
MRLAASASVPSTIALGVALLPNNDSQAEVAQVAPPRFRYQLLTRPAAASPSPPMSTCRRLSYDSAIMGNGSPSRTRASPRSTTSSRSHSRPLPQQPQHFWQRCVPGTEATTTAVGRRYADTCEQAGVRSLVAEARSPSISIGSAAALSSPDVAPSAVVADVHAHVTTNPLGAAGPAGAHEQRPREAAAAAVAAVATSADAYKTNCGSKGGSSASPPSVASLQVTTTAVAAERESSGRANAASLPSSAAATPSAAAPRPLPTRRHSTTTNTPASSTQPIAQPQPQRAAPPPQPRRSRSAKSGVRGSGTHPSSVYFQPVPTLRNVGTGGPSPFSANQLAMPRRPQPRPAVATAGDVASWTGCLQREQDTATVAAATVTSAHQRAPPVQLVRPADLCRGAASAIGGGDSASTAMAASLLPGAAAAQDRLQLPHRSRLARTPSSTAAQQRRRTPSVGSCGARGSARNAESVVSSTPLKRRALTNPAGSAAEAPVEGSAARLAPRRSHSSRLSGPPSLYTTRGVSSGRSPLGPSRQSVPDDGTAGVAAALRKGVARSSSAPAPQQRRASSSSRTSNDVPCGVTSRSIRASNGSGAPAVAPPTLVRSASVRSVQQQRPRTTTTPSGSSLARALASTAGPAGSSARNSASAKGTLSSLQTATASMAAEVLNMSTASTARRVDAGSTRPTISTAGAGGPRARPVVSMATAAGTTAAVPAAASAASGARRLADRKLRDRSGGNTVWASHSSMISMEESKAFLEEFQRMNEHELALFGTLLATVATEQQKRSGRRGNAASSAGQVDATCLVGNAAGDRGTVIAPSMGIITSAEDVTVWACKRTLSLPAHQQQQQASDAPQQTTPEERAAVATPASHVDEELIVLVQPSFSRSAGPHVPPATSIWGSEAQQQPKQLTQRASRGEGSGSGHVPASPYALERSPLCRQLYQQQCAVAGKATGGRGSGGTAGLPQVSRSPSPAPHPPDSAAAKRETDQQAPPLRPLSSSPAPEDPVQTPTSAREPHQQPPEVFASARARQGGGGGLRPRGPTAVNTSANCTAAGAAQKLSVVTAGKPAHAVHTAPQPKSSAATVVRGAAHDRPSASVAGRMRRDSRRGGGANDGRGASFSPPEQQWRRSVKSYTDTIQSYTPNRLEGSHNGHNENDCGAHLKQGGERLQEDPHAADVFAPSAVSEAAAPLTALKRAKEMAAEMAAAARAKTAVTEKSSTAMTATFSSLPSTIVADSPASGRASGGYATEAAVEIPGVRVTAAQLQLLIEGSRSQANYARYRLL